MKYHLYRQENYKRVRTLTQGKYKDKTIEFGDSILQSGSMEYVWKTKGNGKDNVRIWKCVSLWERGSWMSLTNSLPRLKVVHGKNN